MGRKERGKEGGMKEREQKERGEEKERKGEGKKGGKRKRKRAEGCTESQRRPFLVSSVLAFDPAACSSLHLTVVAVHGL